MAGWSIAMSLPSVRPIDAPERTFTRLRLPRKSMTSVGISLREPSVHIVHRRRGYLRVFGRSRLRLLLKPECRDADLNAVATAQSGALHGVAVHEGFGAERKIFDLKSPADDMHRRMPAADLRVLEKIDVTLRRRANVSGITIEHELLAGKDAFCNFEPAGFHDLLQQSCAHARDESNCDHADQTTE